MNRRTALTLAVAPFALGMPAQGVFGSSAASDAQLNVIRAGVESTMGPEYALQLGLFRKHGLDVTIQPTNSGEAAAAAVLGGAAQIASANTVAVVIAHAKNIPLLLFVPGAIHVATAPTVGLMVSKNSTLQTASDLRGKNIAVSGLRDLGTLSIMMWLKKNGVDPQTVRFLEMQDSVKANAVARGTIDAAEIFSPSLEASFESCRVLTVPYAAIADRFLINGWFANQSWLEANRSVASRFAQATIEAQLWANDNHAKSGQMLASYTQLRPEMIAKMTRVTFPQRLSTALVQPVVDAAAEFNYVPAPFTADQIIASVA